MGRERARVCPGSGPRRAAWSSGHTCRLLATAPAGQRRGGGGVGGRAASCLPGSLAELCLLLPPSSECVTGAEGAARDPHSDPGSNLFKSSRLRAFPGLDPRSQIPAWVWSTEPRGKGEEAPSSARWPPRGVPPALCSSGASSHLTTCLGMFTAAHGGPAARLECAGPG